MYLFFLFADGEGQRREDYTTSLEILEKRLFTQLISIIFLPLSVMRKTLLSRMYHFRKFGTVKKKISSKRLKDVEGPCDVLNILSPGFDGSINNLVHKRILQLEHINNEHQRNVNRLASKISYIQQNIGLSTNASSNSPNTMLANKLIDMSTNEVYNLIISICGNKKNQISQQVVLETELSILMSHLVFRNALNTSIFSRIIMHMSLENVKKIEQSLAMDPEEFICDWNINLKARMVCGLSIAARYRLLKSYENSQRLIKNEFSNTWMKLLMHNIAVLNISDFKNFINVVDGLVENVYLVQCALEIKSDKFLYCFWEKYYWNSYINEALEEKIQKHKENMALNLHQIFLIRLFNSSLISGAGKKWQPKIITISKKLNLSSLEDDQVDKAKFIAYVEIFLNEIEDTLTDKPEEKEMFEELLHLFSEFQQEACEDTEKELVYNFKKMKNNTFAMCY